MEVPAALNVTRIMRGQPAYYPLVALSPACIQEAQLYSGRVGADAVEAVVFQYGQLLSELRALRRRCHHLDDEGRALDERLEALQRAARAILEL